MCARAREKTADYGTHPSRSHHSRTLVYEKYTPIPSPAKHSPHRPSSPPRHSFIFLIPLLFVLKFYSFKTNALVTIVKTPLRAESGVKTNSPRKSG